MSNGDDSGLDEEGEAEINEGFDDDSQMNDDEDVHTKKQVRQLLA